MASIVFPATYKEIISTEQLDFMMDWMYSHENIRKQMEEEGHVYFIAYKGDEPCGYVSVQPQEDLYFIYKRFMCSRLSKDNTWVVSYFGRLSSI